MPAPLIYRPVYIKDDGQLHSLPNGGLINAGGTTSPTFTVGGHPIPTFDSLTLQGAYVNSTDVDGNASIQLVAGKDLVFYDDNDRGIFLKIDSTTGAVTITGDLTVLGNTSINSSVMTADHWNISPNTGTQSALIIEPDIGVSFVTDPVKIKVTNGGPDSITVRPDGSVYISELDVGGNLNVAGLINNIDLASLVNTLQQHTTFSTSIKHAASEISVLPGSLPTQPNVTNVQQALTALSTEIANIESNSGGGGVGNVVGFEHIQDTVSVVWVINHFRNSTRVLNWIYDTDGEEIMPDSFRIIDANTVEVRFTIAQAGRAILATF